MPSNDKTKSSKSSIPATTVTPSPISTTPKSSIKKISVKASTPIVNEIADEISGHGNQDSYDTLTLEIADIPLEAYGTHDRVLPFNLKEIAIVIQDYLDREDIDTLNDAQVYSLWQYGLGRVRDISAYNVSKANGYGEIRFPEIWIAKNLDKFLLRDWQADCKKKLRQKERAAMRNAQETTPTINHTNNSIASELSVNTELNDTTNETTTNAINTIANQRRTIKKVLTDEQLEDERLKIALKYNAEVWQNSVIQVESNRKRIQSSLVAKHNENVFTEITSNDKSDGTANGKSNNTTTIKKGATRLRGVQEVDLTFKPAKVS